MLRARAPPVGPDHRSHNFSRIIPWRDHLDRKQSADRTGDADGIAYRCKPAKPANSGDHFYVILIVPGLKQRIPYPGSVPPWMCCIGFLPRTKK